MEYLFDPALFQFDWIDVVYLLTGILVLAMGLYVSYRERGTTIGRVYFLFTVAISFWTFNSGLLMATQTQDLAELLVITSNIPVLFIPATLFHYTRILLDKHREQRFQIQLIWFISTLFALIQLSGHLSHAQLYSFGYYNHYKLIGYIHFVYFVVIVSWIYYCFIRDAARMRYNETAKRRMRLITIALLVSLLAAEDFLPTLGYDVQPVGALFALFLFSMTTYVTLKYRLVDITAEFAAENLLNIIQSPVVIFDLGGAVRLCNPAAEAKFNQATFERIRQELFEDIKDMMTRSNDIQSVTDHSKLFGNENRFYEISLSPIYSRNNEMLALTCLFTDITDRIRYEEALSSARDQLELSVEERTAALQDEVSRHKATVAELEVAKEKAMEASHAKSVFLSRMSHELRTPMNAIMGFSQLLIADLDEINREEDRVYIQNIHKAGNHLLSLITDILDLSRIELDRFKLQLDQASVIDVMEECLVLVDHMADVRGILVELAREQCRGVSVYADKTRFKQIMINLLNNAVKYGRDNGYVKVDCTIADGRVRLSVEDNGIGIPEDMKQRVFMPFERLSNVPQYSEGAGIGLALSQYLAQIQGGNIGFKSAEGVGTTFWLELPWVEEGQADGFSPMV